MATVVHILPANLIHRFKMTIMLGYLLSFLVNTETNLSSNPLW